jgi:hypothetical protein
MLAVAKMQLAEEGTQMDCHAALLTLSRIVDGTLWRTFCAK